MTWEEIERLPRETLLILLRQALRNLVRVDGYWFMEMEKLVGQEKTVAADEAVWRRFGSVEAYQIKRDFSLEGEPIPALIRALNLSPTWVFFGEFRVDSPSPREAVLKVTRCLSQESRVKMGLGVFPCRGVDEAYFTAFAQTIDPRIKVVCELCPPEEYYPDLWCQWRFRLEE